MGAQILTPRTRPVISGLSGLPSDLVHTDIIRISGGVEFAAGWVDDTPPATGATARHEEDT